MRTLVPILATATSLSLSTVAFAADFALEGSYTITSRDACNADQIDTVVLYTDPDGTRRAAFSSAPYTLVYQQHVVSWDGGNDLSGYTDGSSRQDATFTAETSESGDRISGTVDSTVCDAPWSFVAERVALPAFDAPLTPFATTPSIEDIVGSYVAATASSRGTLRIAQLPDGRIVANYGRPDIPRIANFDAGVLDTEGGAIELYAFDYGDTHLKWVLSYGYVNGQKTLRGYVLSRWGHFYPVTATAR